MATTDPVTAVTPAPVTAAGYHIVKALGQGAFGVTYLALKGNQEYTIKVPLSKNLAQANEVRILHAIESDCLYHLMCLVDEPNIPSDIIISRYVPGESLGRKRLAFDNLVKPALSLTELDQIATEMLVAITALQSLGIAHRDIKPDNIIWGPRSNYDATKTATLIDFGVATNLAVNTPAGSWAFLPPTLAGGVIGDLTNRNSKISLSDLFKADLYALGVTLFQLSNSVKYPFELVAGTAGLPPKFNYNQHYPSSYPDGMSQQGHSGAQLNLLIETLLADIDQQTCSARDLLLNWSPGDMPEIKHGLSAVCSK